MLIRRAIPLIVLALAGCASSQTANLDTGDIDRELRKRGLEPEGVVIPYEITEEMRENAQKMADRIKSSRGL